MFEKLAEKYHSYFHADEEFYESGDCNNSIKTWGDLNDCLDDRETRQRKNFVKETVIPVVIGAAIGVGILAFQNRNNDLPEDSDEA